MTDIGLQNNGNNGTRLQGRWLTIARAVWILMSAGTLVIFVIGSYNQLHKSLPACTTLDAECGPWTISQEDIQLGQQLGMSGQFLFLLATIGMWFPRLAMVVIATIIFWHKSSDWVALILSIMLMLGTTEGITEVGALLPLQVTLYSLGIVLFVLIPFVFPNGRFMPRWTLWLTLPLALAFILAVAMPRYIGLVSAVWLVVAAYAVIYRYRRVFNAVERQQTKWVMIGLLSTTLAFIPAIISTFIFPPTHPSPERLAFMFLVFIPTYSGVSLFFPICIGIAIFRYRLWNIDLIINRTLVYGTLTLSTMAIYALVVGYFGNLFQSSDRSGLAFLATGLVALVFQPMRLWLQRIINRLFYGNRDNPAEVLSNLGKRLESVIAPDAILPAVAESIALALRFPYVAVMLKERTEFALAAEYGQPPASNLTCERFPLNYRNEPIGLILVSRRGGEASFSSDEKSLLENIAHQVSVAAHAVQLTRDLQHSRERLVTAREEERRRLRRDLHDGLGPTLASLTLKLDAARNQLKQNPNETDVLLGELKSQTQSAIEDIRRLAYNLRPPALDELGLLSAIQEYAANLSRAGLTVRIECNGEFPKLPAAVEVAAYRIVCEALTNVSKHSQATECDVRLTFNGALQIDVQDNGIGLPQGSHSGVGMFSMRERAAELGGTFAIQSNTRSGIHITAHLPCEVSSDEL